MGVMVHGASLQIDWVVADQLLSGVDAIFDGGVGGAERQHGGGGAAQQYVGGGVQPMAYSDLYFVFVFFVFGNLWCEQTSL